MTVYYFMIRLAKAMFSPLQVCTWFVLIGALFLWDPNYQEAGRILISVGVICLLLCSTSYIPDLLLRHLEGKYPSHMPADGNVINDVKFIVVLAGGYMEQMNMPITSNFSYEGIVRLIEGVRLHKLYDKSKLVLSGGTDDNSMPIAEAMKELSLALGVSDDDIILESKSTNTYEEAVYTEPIVNNHKFILVTSASHMLRAMGIFKKKGMNPIAAPTGYLVKGSRNLFPFFSSPYDLIKVYILANEAMAFLKGKILGRI